MWLFPLPHERQLPSEDMTQRETSVSAGASRCSQQKRRVMGIKPVDVYKRQIQTKVNVAISPEQEARLKTSFGELMPLLYKTEDWLMLSFEDHCRLYFKGSGEAAAFVEVKLYGAADRGAYNKMTAAVTALLNKELNIPSERIYVDVYKRQGYSYYIPNPGKRMKDL